jgi:hypothetical protein
MLSPRDLDLALDDAKAFRKNKKISATSMFGVPGVIRTRDPRFHTTSVFTAA